MVFAALSQTDPSAGAIMSQLKALLPEGPGVTGGTKQDHELAFWLDADPGGDQSLQARFTRIAKAAGWYDYLLALDGIQVNLAKHAAGVVILERDDLKRLPQCSADGVNMMTGYDMYSLDALKFLKIDILGLRTLDIVSDAHIMLGGSGSTPDMMELWKRERNNNLKVYELLCAADSMGVFQAESSGFRRTLKDFQPQVFDHIAQLGALFRPGTIGAKRADGKNMMEVFIDRLHGRERIDYGELREVLAPILDETQGICLYQEQTMQVSRAMAGFNDAEADNLRKAIGKKQLDRMAAIKEDFVKGCIANGYTQQQANGVFENISASARYAFNRSHSYFYGVTTWLCAFFKANQRVDIPELGLHGWSKAAFYVALTNSLSEDAERQADAIAEARQHVDIKPPDINIAEESYSLDNNAIVFGLNGIKGMGPEGRLAIIMERFLCGPFSSFENFQRRLPSLGIDKKLSLIRCGAFDKLEQREWLLARAQCPPSKDGTARSWTMAEFIKHNCGLKKPRDLPHWMDCVIPTQRELGQGELEVIGFYISNDPMAEITRALRRLDTNHIGGEVVPKSIKLKIDKAGNEMAWFTILSNALNKQRVMVFGSYWSSIKHLVVPGERIILHGYMDGNQWNADNAFRAGDYRHLSFLHLVDNDGNRRNVVWDRHLSVNDRLRAIETYELQGYKVELR
jgi:DNA polymerase-3 subunit alpha